MDETHATVRKIAGRLVLDDPAALAVARAVGKHNCENTLRLNADRVAHFMRRISEKGLSPADVVIVVLNVDDAHGGPLAEALMPGQDWQPYRDRGEVPFARGLAGREGIESAISFFDEEAARALHGMVGVAVVVVDHGVAAIYQA